MKERMTERVNDTHSGFLILDCNFHYDSFSLPHRKNIQFSMTAGFCLSVYSFSLCKVLTRKFFVPVF